MEPNNIIMLRFLKKGQGVITYQQNTVHLRTVSHNWGIVIQSDSAENWKGPDWMGSKQSGLRLINLTLNATHLPHTSIQCRIVCWNLVWLIFYEMYVMAKHLFKPQLFLSNSASTGFFFFFFIQINFQYQSSDLAFSTSCLMVHVNKADKLSSIFLTSYVFFSF